jgi:cytochrome c oxidase assembly factor CtaG
MRNVWQRAGTGRGIKKRQYGSFFGALLALCIAFVSPLDSLSEVLFSAHMIQHMILMLIAAPLLVMSDLPLAFLWALPRNSAQGLGYRWNQSRPLVRIWQILRSPLCLDLIHDHLLDLACILPIRSCLAKCMDSRV